ncbi:MAG: redox-regulated ATPase YchF [Spirochaetes bacterium]|nr:redox-regulated ATPase YchF [Spirochaetota bacterium]
MKAALIGTQYSGKTLVFEAMTGLESGRKEENIGTIKVPDERIDHLKGVFKPKKTTYAEFVISDFTLPQDSQSVISSKVKNLIQKADILLIVLRNFNSELSSEPADTVNEYKKIRDEIILGDYLVVEKRLEKEEKEKKNTPDIPVLKKLKKILEEFKFPKEDDFTAEELKNVVNYSFLSLKKLIVIVNQEEGKNDVDQELVKMINEDALTFFSVSAKLENELVKIPVEERQTFLEEFGLNESASIRLIKHIYKQLGFISFLTMGEDEVRAWPIKNGITAVQAAGKIHSDIEKGFIRAEVISFDDFSKYNSEAECKKAGRFRLEGKEYQVKDGDIISFRFNV